MACHRVNSLEWEFKWRQLINKTDSQDHFSPQRTFSSVWRQFGCRIWGLEVWVESRHSATHPPVHRMQPTPVGVVEAEVPTVLIWDTPPSSSDGRPSRTSSDNKQVPQCARGLPPLFRAWAVNYCARVKMRGFFSLEYLRFDVNFQ